MDAVVVEKDMSASMAEIGRSLERLLGPAAAAFDGRRLTVAEGNGKIEITVVATGERRIGILALPTVRLRIKLSGIEPAKARAFLADFDRAFQRGGG